MASPSPPPPPPPPPPPLLPEVAKAVDSSGKLLSSKLDEEVAYLIQPLLDANGRESCSHDRTRKKVITFVCSTNSVVQNGPVCGLVAISMASQLLRQSMADCDETSPEVACDPSALLEFAKDQGLSKQGEMFSVEYMLSVARHGLRGLPCHGEVVSSDLLDLMAVVSGLTAGKAILVPYDADKDHTPCLARGHKAHWCLLVGFVLILDDDLAPGLPGLLECCHPTSPASDHYSVMQDRKDTFSERLGSYISSHDSSSLLDSISIFARQGKSRHMGLWGLHSLLSSNGQLVEVDPQRADPEEYVVPADGIAGGLCSKALVVSLQKTDLH